MSQHRRFHTVIQIYKILTKRSLSYLHSTFRTAVSVTGRAGHNAHGPYVPAVNLNYGKRSMYYHGTAIWNSLSTLLTEAESLHVLR